MEWACVSHAGSCCEKDDQPNKKHTHEHIKPNYGKNNSPVKCCQKGKYNLTERERQGNVKEVVQTKQGKAQSAPQTWITKGWQAHIDPLWLEHGLNINSKNTKTNTTHHVENTHKQTNVHFPLGRDL